MPDSSTGRLVTRAFRWTTFDLATQLPGDWQQEIAAAAAEADFRDYPCTPGLTRESADVQHIPRGRLHASDLRRTLPWLYKFYRTAALDLAREISPEPVAAAADDRYGVVLNLQRGPAMRFECHVDSNPLTGLLFCTDHQAGTGGELVFAHDPAATHTGAVDRDCSVIRPHAGHLIFFDGRYHPHYARPLRSAEPGQRIVAVMNFYTRSCPESMRPRELNRHLFGQPLTNVPSGGNGSSRRSSRRAVDGRAAQDGVAVVEHCGLAPGHAARCMVQANA
jgi:hypothetical protein